MRFTAEALEPVKTADSDRNLIAAVLMQAHRDLSPTVNRSLKNATTQSEWRRDLADFRSSVRFFYHDNQNFEWMATLLGFDVDAVRERCRLVLLRQLGEILRAPKKAAAIEFKLVLETVLNSNMKQLA